jgi:hypothetical protein
MGFWVRPELGAEGLGEHGEGDVAVPAGERAAFEVVQSQAVLELAVIVLYPPRSLATRTSSAVGVSAGRLDSQ